MQARDGDSGINDPVYYEKISEQEEHESKCGIIDNIQLFNVVEL